MRNITPHRRSRSNHRQSNQSCKNLRSQKDSANGDEEGQSHMAANAASSNPEQGSYLQSFLFACMLPVQCVGMVMQSFVTICMLMDKKSHQMVQYALIVPVSIINALSELRCAQLAIVAARQGRQLCGWIVFKLYSIGILVYGLLAWCLRNHWGTRVGSDSRTSPCSAGSCLEPAGNGGCGAALA